MMIDDDDDDDDYDGDTCTHTSHFNRIVALLQCWLFVNINASSSHIIVPPVSG